MTRQQGPRGKGGELGVACASNCGSHWPATAPSRPQKHAGPSQITAKRGGWCGKGLGGRASRPPWNVDVSGHLNPVGDAGGPK